VDDIEHEFKIEDKMNNHDHSAEAMLHGKMSYGRGPEDDENAHFPAVIAGGRSRNVRIAPFLILLKLDRTCNSIQLNLLATCMQVSGEFPISSHSYGEQMLSSLHKRVHPYSASDPRKM